MSVETHNEPLAIIGIGCRFPGDVSGPQQFWDLLCAGTDATRDIPTDRWDIRKFYDPEPSKLGKMGTHRGGFLESVDQFDAAFFGISPREAVWLDPQQRLLLRAAWEALEDAGLLAEQLAGSDTGVFIGGFTLDYQLLQNYGVQSRYELQAHSATGMMMTMLANRLSYSFDFRGPSLTVDTACSGSLVALHLGAQAIWNGECSLAMVGGVNVMLAPNMTIAESKGGFLSPDGRCKTFDSSANGYARGEGAGIVVLKPLSKATADGDPVYALVRGSAISQDGHTNGITVPSGPAQEVAMRSAYARAGVPPRDVDYVEAHGTGTPVGDPIEAAAIGRVLSTDRPAGKPILIGSVKTNIGHLEAAAGIAGVIKTALSLKHGRIPAHLHLQEPNPAIPFEEFGLQVPTCLTEWPQHDGPRYAGINSFGFGGTNAHVVLEGVSQPAPTRPADTDHRRHLFVLSARSPEALRDLAISMGEVFKANEHRLADVAYSCSRRRTAHEHRLALVAKNAEEAEGRLHAYLEDDRKSGVVTGRPSPEEKPKLVFVCSGMGPQWWNMARQLLETEPVFREAVDRVAAELSKYTGWSLTTQMLASEDESRMPETDVAQPSNFAVQVGLAALWRSWGIEPDAIIGHSAGEVAAQYLAGVLSFEDAVKVVYYRSSLQQRTSGSGRMLAVGMTPETLNQAVADAGPQVSVAAINSPNAVTLSGDSTVLEGMAAQLETFGVFHRFLPVKVPFHSHFMDPLRAELEAGLADIQPQTATIPLYSTVTGTRIDGRAADAKYWWQNIRATVLFSAGFSQMVDDGYTHFVELSAHPVLASAMKELLPQPEPGGLVIPSLRRDNDDVDTLLQSLGSLHCHGHEVCWDALESEDASFVPLPNYPWQSKSYWNESQEAREDRHYAPVHPLLGQRVNAAHPSWEHEINDHVLPYLKDHRIQDNTILPGAAMIEMALAAAHAVYGDGDFGLAELRFHKAVLLGRTSDARLRTTLRQAEALVEIASYVALPNGDRQWTVHATARLVPRTQTPASRNIAGLAAHPAGRHVERDEFYTQTEAMGFQYGPAFQAVRSITADDWTAIGRISIPDDVAPEIDDYLFHPSLVDAAFQVLLIAGTPSDAQGERGTPFLPVGADSISVVSRPTKEMIVIAEVRESNRSRIISDITVCDPSGRVLVEINGFTAQSLAASASLSPERINASLYELQWQPSDRQDPEETLSQSAGEDAWLIFADSGGFAAEMIHELRAAGQRVLTVTRAGTNSTNAIDTFQIDPTDPEQYHHLIRAVQARTITKVVHLWSLDIAFGEADSGEDLLSAQEIGSMSAMRLMQALSAELTQTPKVWFVTRGAQAVGEPSSEPNLAQAPLWGLGRVIGHQEFLSLWGGLCDLDPNTELTLQAKILVGEIDSGDSEDQIAFRDQQRYVNRLVVSSNLTPPLPLRLRAAGSYLITGGLGALGLVVARFLVERGARDVILMGRTRVPSRQSWSSMADDHPQRPLVDKLLELESLGARVSLAAVDSSKPDELSHWLSAHQQQGLPPVVGVIHAAGVVDDQLLVRMDSPTFTKVLAPKLGGGWELHRLFRDTTLDFFVLFSSTGSVIASAGQGNYAAGNAFLDALASYRKSQGLPGLSIGWGPWSVGMVEQLNLEQMYTRRGIELITPESGMQILGRVLYQRPSHLVAITADWGLARETSLVGLLPPMFEQVHGSDQVLEADGNDTRMILLELAKATEEEREAILVDCISAAAVKVLGLDADQIPATETLSNLGLDSIMAIEMKHRIDSALQTDISVLDMLQGATIAGLAEKLLAKLAIAGVDHVDDAIPGPAEPVEDSSQLDELEQILALTGPDELELLLRELEAEEPYAGVVPHDRSGAGQ